MRCPRSLLVLLLGGGSLVTGWRTAHPEALVRLGGTDRQGLASCDGGEAVVTGRRSAYVIAGSCRALTVQGDLLTVRAELQPGAHVSVTGEGSVVTWTAAVSEGSPPVGTVQGAGSRVQKALPPD